MKAQIGRVGPGINDLVGALRGADFVEEDLLVGAGRRVGHFVWAGIAGVEKAGAIGQPGGVGEFSPAQHLVAVLAAF